jgi:hypothetical protein
VRFRARLGAIAIFTDLIARCSELCMKNEDRTTSLPLNDFCCVHSVGPVVVLSELLWSPIDVGLIKTKSSKQMPPNTVLLPDVHLTGPRFVFIVSSVRNAPGNRALQLQSPVK